MRCADLRRLCVCVSFRGVWKDAYLEVDEVIFCHNIWTVPRTNIFKITKGRLLVLCLITCFPLLVNNIFWIIMYLTPPLRNLVFIIQYHIITVYYILTNVNNSNTSPPFFSFNLPNQHSIVTYLKYVKHLLCANEFLLQYIIFRSYEWPREKILCNQFYMTLHNSAIFNPNKRGGAQSSSSIGESRFLHRGTSVGPETSL